MASVASIFYCNAILLKRDNRHENGATQVISDLSYIEESCDIQLGPILFYLSSTKQFLPLISTFCLICVEKSVRPTQGLSIFWFRPTFELFLLNDFDYFSGRNDNFLSSFDCWSIGVLKTAVLSSNSTFLMTFWCFSVWNVPSRLSRLIFPIDFPKLMSFDLFPWYEDDVIRKIIAFDVFIAWRHNYCSLFFKQVSNSPAMARSGVL